MLRYRTKVSTEVEIHRYLYMTSVRSKKRIEAGGNPFDPEK
jgi:hypothetical protein